MKLSDIIFWLWGEAMCLTLGFVFIYAGLYVIPYLPIENPYLPIEKPIPRELWQLIFLGAGLSWILTLPTSIILWGIKSKLSSLSSGIFISIVVIAVIIAVVERARSTLLFIGLSYLLYIPHSLALYMLFLPLYYESKLSTIGYKINVLRERISEYETILDQRSKIEKDIESIVAFDPSNLNVKARELQEKTQGMIMMRSRQEVLK